MLCGTRAIEAGQESKIVGGVYYDPKKAMEFQANQLWKANLETIDEIKK